MASADSNSALLSGLKLMSDSASIENNGSSFPDLRSTTNKPLGSTLASRSTVFASTSTSPFPRLGSPSSSTTGLSVPAVPPFGTSGTVSPNQTIPRNQDDPRLWIPRAFAPNVVIKASQDTDEIAKLKGLQGGFRELLRPFGDSIQGKVTVRDSVGASKTWEDFGVRFVGVVESQRFHQSGPGRVSELQSNGVSDAPSSHFNPTNDDGTRTGCDLGKIEEIVDRHLQYAESSSARSEPDYLSSQQIEKYAMSNPPPFHALYLRRLLSGMPLSPHETFSHPVACVIAISSRAPNPIESLRQLYESSGGDTEYPTWVNRDFLRYYVLVHDEDHSDITKSTALFDQMKRHFGLHCHLLRLRSSQCVPSDDGSVAMPKCEWVTAAEEIANVERNEEDEENEFSETFIYDSDAAALRTFVREMVTQSIVPFMERCVTTWNDQVASRRRGLSGRFMSLSKKWTGFGTSRGTSGGHGAGSGGVAGVNGSYDPVQGVYRPDTAEATMRKLADYAFMLRDWKLAQGTYDVLRADFNNDKAWKYHAGANEMSAISTLLVPQSQANKVRPELIDQLLDTASYSYMTRCAASYETLRCLAVAVELLRSRGGLWADIAARWETRALEAKIMGPIGQCLFTERVADCYAGRKGAGSERWGARRRKCALWNVLAANSWLDLRKSAQAQRCLEEALLVYDQLQPDQDRMAFDQMQLHLDQLVLRLRSDRAAVNGTKLPRHVDDDQAASVDEESEKLDRDSHRRSTIGLGTSPFANLETATDSPLQQRFLQSSGDDNTFR
ncbi:MAG: hypothetical protein M1825_005719 [Sarcosagium campestre]|nr:MAG: hypothetical protein M1825_005719 [Sarcosagium campestre]